MPSLRVSAACLNSSRQTVQLKIAKYFCPSDLKCFNTHFAPVAPRNHCTTLLLTSGGGSFTSALWRLPVNPVSPDLLKVARSRGSARMLARTPNRGFGQTVSPVLD